MICERLRKPLAPIVLTLLRVVVGVIMVTHGWEKFTHQVVTLQQFAVMGLPYPKIALYLAIAGELGGGAGLILGLLTPIASFGVACTMSVAIYWVHLPHGLLTRNGGFEYPLVLFFVALYFMMQGAGAISLDAAFGCKKCCGETCER